MRNVSHAWYSITLLVEWSGFHEGEAKRNPPWRELDALACGLWPVAVDDVLRRGGIAE